jgi:hypothetical protein
VSWLADMTKSEYFLGYEDDSESTRKYRYERAVERDNALNFEERRMYEDTATELEYGEGFLRRAHP